MLTFKKAASSNDHILKSFYLMKNKLIFLLDTFKSAVDLAAYRVTIKTELENMMFEFKDYIFELDKFDISYLLDKINNVRKTTCSSANNNEVLNQLENLYACFVESENCINKFDKHDEISYHT